MVSIVQPSRWIVFACSGPRTTKYGPSADMTFAPGLRNRSRDGRQQSLAGVAGMIVDVVGPLARHDRHDAVPSRETAPHVIRLPRTFFFVFAEAETVFGGRSLGRTIHVAGLSAADVQQGELQRPADGGVRFRRLSEAVAAVIDAEPVADRSADDHHLSAGMRGRQRAMEVVVRVEDRAHRGDDGRESIPAGTPPSPRLPRCSGASGGRGAATSAETARCRRGTCRPCAPPFPPSAA